MNKDLRRFSWAVLLLLAFTTALQAQAPQDKTIAVFGANIHYIEAGDSSRPVVILLHGLGSNTSAWQFNIRPLAQQFHVFAIDQIGFGQSDKPMLKYRAATYADFLDKFMSLAHIEKASLVGNSMGGWVAALTAIKYPNRVDKLVLADAAGIRPDMVDMKLVDSLNFSTRDEVRELSKRVFYNQIIFGSDAAIEAAMQARVSAGDGYTINSLIESVKREEDFIDSRLAEIKTPTLVIWGAQDGLLKPSDGEKFNRGIAGSKLIVFDKCGHVPQLEKAADFNKAVLAFLGGQ
jgi:pimeloyl-ACP methyl ester carboxylesterase